MPRARRSHENERAAKARRRLALGRSELRTESSPRAAAAGPTSHAVKIADPATAAAIEAFLTAKQRNGAGQ